MMAQGVTQHDWRLVGEPPCTQVLGIPIHIIDRDGVVRHMEQWIVERDKCRWIAATCSYVVMEGYHNPRFKTILKSADLSVPDGLWTSWFAGRRATERSIQVRGSDLLWTFCETASQDGYRNFFYGDTERVLARLTRRLHDHFPALNIVGTHSPPFRILTAEEDAQIVKRINEASPDVLWVGLSTPKQHEWIFEHRERLNVPVIVAVGAAFKFVSGEAKSAPPRLSKWGMEWVWRLMHEPKRSWHRALFLGPQFIAHALLELGGLKKYE